MWSISRRLFSPSSSGASCHPGTTQDFSFWRALQLQKLPLTDLELKMIPACIFVETSLNELHWQCSVLLSLSLKINLAHPAHHSLSPMNQCEQIIIQPDHPTYRDHSVAVGLECSAHRLFCDTTVYSAHNLYSTLQSFTSIFLNIKVDRHLSHTSQPCFHTMQCTLFYSNTFHVKFTDRLPYQQL